MNKKIIFFIAILIYGISTYFSYSYFSDNNSAIKNPLARNGQKIISSVDSNGEETVSNEPKTEECPLNGELLTKTQKEAWEKRRPLGIMVENSVDARPQSGLTSADIIYEAVAEGGITRFLTIFYCKEPNYVGPVRSARVYFIQLLREYSDYPLYTHVGYANCDKSTGSGCANGAKADAKGMLERLGWNLYNDINNFSVGLPYFLKDLERLPDRATEHTVYTFPKKLWQLARERGLTNTDKEDNPWNKKFETWKFKNDNTLDKRGSIERVSFGFWKSFADQYAVVWTYDKEQNLFKRENGGQPHLDKNNNKQLTAKNVFVAFMKESPANDGYEGGHILYTTLGEGKAVIFQDGTALTGTWKKPDEETRIKFYTDSGEEAPIVRGQVFIEVLPVGNKVVY